MMKQSNLITKLYQNISIYAFTKISQSLAISKSQVPINQSEQPNCNRNHWQNHIHTYLLFTQKIEKYAVAIIPFP